MKKIIKQLKSFDIFGHSINLNFNSEGPIFQTTLSGIFSIIYIIIIIIYSSLKIIDLISLTNNLKLGLY
jgi:hypothetical protein